MRKGKKNDVETIVIERLLQNFKFKVLRNVTLCVIRKCVCVCETHVAKVNGSLGKLKDFCFLTQILSTGWVKNKESKFI